jgi:hypothetical protein
MPSSGVGDPHRATHVLDQIPDTSASSDLELPLFQVSSAAAGGGEAAAQSVIPFIGWSRSRSVADGLEGTSQVRGSRASELVPAFGAVGVVEADVVLLADAWRSGSTI